VIFSCIIPASKKDSESQKLKDLIASIKVQDFPQDQIEILVITEGDSEQAKAIGIRRARGEICAMFCADNYVVASRTFTDVFKIFYSGLPFTGVYGRHYAVRKDDNSLNRYFSLVGGNDPICFYLGKNDRLPYWDDPEILVGEMLNFRKFIPSLGCNGFFYKRDDILQSDLDHYYPMDNAEDLRKLGKYFYFRSGALQIWHRTSDNLFTFLLRRYRYARDLYCNRHDRRWRMVSAKEDYLRLALYIFFTVTVIQPLFVSIKGFAKIRDFAWFWHWPVCVGFLIMYTILVLRTLCKRALSFRRLEDLNPLTPVSRA